MRRIHRVTSIVVLVAAGAMLAGCSSPSPAADQSSRGSSSQGGSTKGGSAPKDNVLLAAADLPQGMQISPVDVSQSMQQGAGLAKGQPGGGQCAGLQQKAFKSVADLKGVGMSAVQKSPTSSATVVETVVSKPGDLDLDAVRSALTGCSSASTNLGRMSVVVTTTETPLPGVHADQALALHQDIKVQGAPDGVPAPKGNDIALIVVGDRVISLLMNGDVGVTLDQLAQKAVQRVRQA